MWAKNELKEKFAGGISTTSRVESHHAIQKRHSTSNSGLQRGSFRANLKKPVFLPEFFQTQKNEVFSTYQT